MSHGSSTRAAVQLLSGLATILILTACGGSSSNNSGARPVDTADAAVRVPPVNDTGIVTCGDYAFGSTGSGSHNNDISAPGGVCGGDPDGDPVPSGQDAEQGRDALAARGSLIKGGAGDAGFDFTKLDANGNPLAIQDAVWDANGDEQDGNKWSCVRDNHTGLIWEVKINDDRHLRYQGHTYSWYNPELESNSDHTAGTEDGGDCAGGSGCDTATFISDVNAEGLCGHSDWRLPARQELQSIIHYGQVDPAIDTGFFPNTASGWFWSSSSMAGVNASYAYFMSGYLGGNSKHLDYRVRLVREEE